MKKIFLLVLFVSGQSFSQSVLDEYKYINVPVKYEFLKEADQYQLNSLTRFLFNKEGFTVLPEKENYPEDYKQNRCMGLRANLVNNSGMFNTKFVLEMFNWNDKVKIISKEGKSKEKDFKTGYHEALREAIESVQRLNYTYKPKQKPVGEEKPVATNVSKQNVNTAEVKPVINSTVEPVTTTVNENVLYAQPVKNGYQLVDTTPKVVFILQKTSVQNVYIIKGKDGTVFLNDGQWIAEYYEGEELKREVLDIKF